ncbi:hypothetical protein ACFUN7_27935 [Streptomyces sp. NPDC057236]|uniref:hypothetical protein n=1 Tax=Streptomyces sp. NPDC057236 TaxID=3346059 RepID=UPI0036385F86
MREITNNTRRAVNLDGWTLQDEDGRTCTFDDCHLRGRATVRMSTPARGRHTLHPHHHGAPPLRRGGTPPV